MRDEVAHSKGSALVHLRSSSSNRARNPGVGNLEAQGGSCRGSVTSEVLFSNDGSDNRMPILNENGSLLDPEAHCSQRASKKLAWLGATGQKRCLRILNTVCILGTISLIWIMHNWRISQVHRNIGSVPHNIQKLHINISSVRAPRNPHTVLALQNTKALGQKQSSEAVNHEAGTVTWAQVAEVASPKCPARNGTRPDPTEAEKKAARNIYGYSRRQRRYSFEQFPKVVHGDTFRFIMCTIPKNGCSQWKRLILKAMGKPEWFYLDQKTSHLTVHSTRYRYLPMIPKAKMLDALIDPDTPRIIISRNPFTRVLSGFLNKIVKANDRRRYREKLGLDQWSDWVTFEEYIVALEKWAQEKPAGLRLKSGIDHHFALQSSFCGMPNDGQSKLHYDFILKTEQINDWFTCIVKELNISSLVYSGWPADKCFFSAPDHPCDGQTMEGGFSSTQWDARDHSTRSTSKLRSYYTPTLEATIAKLYADDFEIFGYHTHLNKSDASDLGFEWQEASSSNDAQYAATGR